MAHRKTAPGESQPKATNAEINRRVEAIVKMIVSGISRADIQQYAATQFSVSQRVIDEYIARATALLVEAGKANRPAELGKAVKRLENLYMNTVKVQDWKTALAIQKTINDMHGLNAPVKSETTVRLIDMAAVHAELRRKVEAGEMTREELLYVTDNNTTLADELFRGAAHRVQISDEETNRQP